MREEFIDAAMFEQRQNSKLGVYHSDKYPDRQWIRLVGNKEGFLNLIDHIRFMLEHEEIGCIDYDNIEPEWGGRVERDSFQLVVEFDGYEERRAGHAKDQVKS